MTRDEQLRRDVARNWYKCITCKWWSDTLPDEQKRRWPTEGWCSHPPYKTYGPHVAGSVGHCFEYETAPKYTEQEVLPI